MNFQTHNDKSIDLTGTQLVGYIQATRAQLEVAFGSPIEKSSSADEPITTNWKIQFENGKVAMIYDWKRYDRGAPGADEVVDWHIGTHSKRTEWLVHDTFREAHDLKARAA